MFHIINFIHAVVNGITYRPSMAGIFSLEGLSTETTTDGPGESETIQSSGQVQPRHTL